MAKKEDQPKDDQPKDDQPKTDPKPGPEPAVKPASAAEVLDATGAPVARTPKGEAEPDKAKDSVPADTRADTFLNALAGIAVMVVIALIMLGLSKRTAAARNQSPAPQAKPEDPQATS